MRRICATASDVKIFGRPWASGLLGCRHGELFGMSLRKASAARVIAAARQAKQCAKFGARGNLWDLYHLMVGLPMNSGRSERSCFGVIDDITNDFDRPSDYDTRVRLYTAATSSAPLDRWRLALMLARLMPRHLLCRMRGPVAIGDAVH
jgi:hypothetical protein